MRSATSVGSGVMGKLTLPPWTMAVVDVEVGVAGAAPGVVVVVVKGAAWYPDSPCA